MKLPSLKTRVMTITHGKSEYIICCSIRSNLRIKQEIYSDKKGEKSIQINSLMNILNNGLFRSFNDFIREYPDIEAKKKKLIGFKLFIIMDLDDCNDDMKKKFMTKEMFKLHWLYEYIVPVYNDPNLEKTMNDAGIPINRSEKKKYFKIFPTNHGDLNLEMAQEFLVLFKKCRHSNFNEYLEYCISLVQNININRP